jgi:hypothetical protein
MANIQMQTRTTSQHPVHKILCRAEPMPLLGLVSITTSLILAQRMLAPLPTDSILAVTGDVGAFLPGPLPSTG